MPEARNEDHSINRNWLGGIIMVLSPRNIYMCTFNIHHHMFIYSNYVAYIYLFIHLRIKDLLYIPPYQILVCQGF